jgi:hypothetical protein
MFNTRKLFDAIRCGKTTTFRFNRQTVRCTDAAQFQVTREGCSGVFGALGFALVMREEAGYAIGSMRFTNHGSRPIRLAEVMLFSHQEDRRYGCRAERCVYEFQDSLGDDNFVERASAKRGIHFSRPFALIYDLKAGYTFFAGQMSFEKVDAEFFMKFDVATSKLLSLECRMSLDDYPLGPGKTITTDEVALLLDARSTPHDALYGWADAVHERYKPAISQTIPAGFLCGWLISTKAESTASQIRRNLAAAGALKKLGMEYCWTSIDNLPDGMPGNWLGENRKNFPEGVPAMMQEITAAGYKPGLWVAPFLITERSADLKKMQKHLIKLQDGTPNSTFRWYWGTLDEEGQLPLTYRLDAADPEALRYIGTVLKRYAEWGVRYHMLDFLSSGYYRKEEQRHGLAKEAFRKFLRSLKQYTAPDSFLLSAVGTSCSLIGAFDSGRIGMDYGEARQLEPNFESYPANYLINGSYGSCGSPNRNAITNLAMWGFAHNRFFQCNSNMMTVDLPIPLNEAQISATLFGISPSPVFFGDDFERMAPSRFELIKKVLPRCPRMPEAADLFTKTDGRTDFLRVFKLPIQKEWGEWTLCAVFNLNETPRTMELDAAMLGMDAKTAYWMYDFWEEHYLGHFKGRRRIDIPAISCRLFRFTEVTSHPWVLSTDMHVRQGECELADVRWDEKRMTLSGTAIRAAGERGNLLLVSDDEWMEAHFNKGMLVAKSADDDALVIKVPLEFKDDTVHWQVEFMPSDAPRKKSKKSRG